MAELKQETGNRKQETGNRKQETGNRKQETGNRKRFYFAFLGISSVNTFLIKIPFHYTLNEHLSIPKAKRSRLSKRSVLYKTKKGRRNVDPFEP
ncbi:hypothetical protein M445_25175 [Vibrio owensii 47666-1]|nr:hypothetical protein M445_25175 [Vibrio owensii 47666-1]